MTKQDVLIIGGARTPMTDYIGALKDIPALELGAIAARGAFQKTGVRPEWIDHAVIGNVLQTSADAIYGARHVALKAGVPVDVPALTVNRLCGSGVQAAVSGAQMIQLGEASLVLTGGIESMSQAPHVIRGLRTGLKLGQGKLEDYLWEALLDPYCSCTMAMTAENCAAKYGITREEQDCYALRIQQLADKAWREGRFVEEVVPVEIKTSKGIDHVNRDNVNVNGGAIALGHPLGMTGTRLLLTLVLELRRRAKKRGLATACIGGGQGIAAIVEAI